MIDRLQRLAYTSIALLAAALTTGACQPGSEMPLAIPTAIVVEVTATPEAASSGEKSALPADIVPGMTPTVLATVQPVSVSPDSEGITMICPGNSLLVTPQVLDGGTARPTHTVSHISALGDFLYVAADGGLYRAEMLAVDAGAGLLYPVLVPGDDIDGRAVQEVADIAVDQQRGYVYVLDKAGHVFRYSHTDGGITLAHRTRPDLSVDLSPQMVAIALDGQGDPVLLDSAFGVIWGIRNVEERELLVQYPTLTQGVSMASANGRVYVLLRSGGIQMISEAWRGQNLYSGKSAQLAIALASPADGEQHTVASVDGIAREIRVHDAATGAVTARFEMGIHDAGILRDVVITDSRMYVLAGDRIIVFPGPPTPGMPLTCMRPQSYARPTLYGTDVVTAMRGWVYPIEEGTLPEWPRVYPGAGRIYRVGVHRGVDIFFWNGPADFGFETPALALASGRVVHASLDYEPVTVEEFNAMVAETNIVGYTPEALLDRFAGKQVILDHGAGRFSVYSHLDKIAPGIAPGEIVRAGQMLGTVGVTGTQGEAEPGTAAPHLHFEILLDGRYLGYGITINEAMWWYAQIFEDQAP